MIVCYLVGDRTIEDCIRFIMDVDSRIDSKPLFTSDKLPHYEDALLEAYHTLETPKPSGKRGRPPKSRKVVDPELDYAVVHKIRKDNRVVKVEREIIFGDPSRIELRLVDSISNTINTAYIERSNGTLRQHVSCLCRKSLCFAKMKKLLEAKIAIIVAYYNFIRPHTTLSRNPDRTFTPRTPAQVAGITKLPWSFGYLLSIPFPPQ